MQSRIKVIFNPHADRGRSWDRASHFQSVLERHGGASWSASEYPGHSTELAEQAAKEGFHIVVAMGGDGTVHEVLNGIMRVPKDQRPTLAIVPIGSGNDFGSNIGVSPEPEQAIERLFSGQKKQIDVGQITDSTGRLEFWDNTLGIGFDATVTLYSYKITRLQGFTMYLWAVIQTIIRNHDAPRMKIVTDQEEIDQEVLMFVACNGPREGGGFYVAPDAVPDDGWLHYAMIKNVSRAMMFRLIPEVMNGTHGRFRQVKMGQFRELHLTSERPVMIHLDGEVFAGFHSDITDVRIKILPGELTVIT
ncbi:MAG: diacylglycerol kinase family lipid kinase [Anaerolineales bacterium]|nr:MAG: diacylglycerol kinase family lipid kinase [Anaerolineales bacterium]